MKFDIHNKKFIVIENSASGEVGLETTFHYRQDEAIIWATYEGGAVKFGILSGIMTGDTLIFNYQHQNLEGAFLTGKCESRIEIRNGKLRLNENWQWTCKDFSKGTSVLKEI